MDDRGDDWIRIRRRELSCWVDRLDNQGKAMMAAQREAQHARRYLLQLERIATGAEEPDGNEPEEILPATEAIVRMRRDLDGCLAEGGVEYFTRTRNEAERRAREASAMARMLLDRIGRLQAVLEERDSDDDEPLLRILRGGLDPT